MNNGLLWMNSSRGATYLQREITPAYVEGRNRTGKLILVRAKTKRRFACFNNGMERARMTKITFIKVKHSFSPYTCRTVPAGDCAFGGWYISKVTLVPYSRSA